MPQPAYLKKLHKANRAAQAARNAEAAAATEAARARMKEAAGELRAAFLGEDKALRPATPAPVHAPVSYASKSAEKLGTEAGLNASHFAGLEPSGAKGYTTADVRNVLASLEARAGSGYETK